MANNNKIFNKMDDGEIYEDHFLYGLRKVPTGHVRVYGPSDAEMKMELESINKAKTNKTIESILGAADLAMIAGGIYLDMHVLKGNGSIGAAGGFACAAIVSTIYCKMKYGRI